MKELLLQFARYNLWANKRIIDALAAPDEELLDKEIESSFNTIRKTVYHMWNAEFIWLQRLQLTEQPVSVIDVFKGDFKEACEDWGKVSEVLLQFIEKQYDDKAFGHVFQYYNSQKRSHKNKVGAILLHVFNHATYHRGQLITMMRQAGITKVPNTDFSNFVQ